MTIMMKCFREPRGAEVHYEEFCNWAQEKSSSLVDPVTIELGIMLKRSPKRKTYSAVQKTIDSLRSEESEEVEKLWSVAAPGRGPTPKLMLNEILALSSKNLVRDVPFCYVVATHFGDNQPPLKVLGSGEYQSDTYGTQERLLDYLSKRWAVDQKFFGVGDVHDSFKANPPQWQRFSSQDITEKKWWQFWK